MQIRTANAMKPDDLSDEDYRTIFEELRQGFSLRGFVKRIESSLSHAQWDKYEKGEALLSRTMKSELRRAVKLPPLPLTVLEAVADVDPDATVAVLEGSELNFVLIGNSADIRWEGFREKLESEKPKRVRPKVSRPYVEIEIDERRRQLGVEWKDVIEAGLAVLESRRQDA